MKRKIFSVLFALVLVVSFSLVTAVPAAAQAPTPTVTFRTSGTGTAAWSAEQPHSGLRSAKMTTITTSDYGGVRFEFAPGELTLDDLTTLSYWEYVSARDFGTFVDVFIDIWLDFDDDGDADTDDYPGYMQAEPLYTVGEAPLNTWTPIDAMNLKWSTLVGPDYPYYAPTIYDFQNLTYSPPPPPRDTWTIDTWTNNVDFGQLDILRIDIRVGYGGTWANFTGYADDIVINGYTQGFEPLDEVWVDDDFDPSTTGWGYDSFATIQDGIDAVAEDGVVNVLAGTYDEDVTINKSLTLVSAEGKDNTTINGQSTGYTGAVRITANNVVFGGDGTGFTVNGSGTAAVYFTPVSGCLVEGNDVVAASGKNALVTEGGQSNHTIEGNTFSGNPASQLVYVNGQASVGNASTNVDFIDNIFAGTATGPALGQEAADSTISGNTFATVTGYASLELWGDDNIVTGNYFTANLPAGGVYVWDQSGTLDIDAVLGNNDFLRAVVVNHPSSSLLPIIWAYIQDGVNVAVTGDTVIVAAGQYNENVAIGARLTLQGAGSGNNPASDTIITPPSGYNGIDICLPLGGPAVPTLVIENLRVAGATKDGIQITDTGGDPNQGNIALINVACVGNAVGGYGMGVDLNLNPTASAEDLVVTDCVFSGNGKFGFKINHGAASVKIAITGGAMNGNEDGLRALGHPGSIREISVDGVTFGGNTGVGVDFGAHDDYCFNGGVVNLQNLIVVDNGIGMRFKGEGVASSYGPGFLLPAGTISVLYCAITGNNTGVVIQNYSNLDNMGLHYNNFCGNTVGLDNQCADTVDATNNWWCHPSGPKASPGYGNPVSGDVLYDPWMLEPVVPGAPLPTTFDKTLALNVDWTLVSTDNWIDPAKTVGVGVILAINYTPSDGWFEVDPTALVPVDALYLKTVDGGALGIDYSGGVPIASSKLLEAGWNLVSSATHDDAKAVLSPLRYIDVGDEQGVGLTTLVSQGPFNQHTSSFYLATLVEADWTILGATMLNPFDGYWIYMNDGKVFGVVPGH